MSWQAKWWGAQQSLIEATSIWSVKKKEKKGVLNHLVAPVVELLSHVRLCNPMDCSTPGFPVLHCLPELASTHAHRVGDAIEQSPPLSSPSPPAFSLSQLQGLFPWVGCLHQVTRVIGVPASILPMNIQGWLLLGVTGLTSLLSKSLLQHHNFFSIPNSWEMCANK